MKQATRFSVQRTWKLLIADLGANPAEVLAVAGLPADLFSRSGILLGIDDYFSLWRALEEVAGDIELPLKMGQSISVESFEPLIFASLCSRNLNIALQRLSQFKRLLGPLTLTIAVGRNATSAELACYGHKGKIPRSVGIFEMVFLTQLARMATRRAIVPREVLVAQMPNDPGSYRDWFGVPLRGGKVNRVTFSAEDAARPFLTEDAAMWDFFEPALRQRLSDIDAEASTVERVRAVLLALLPSGQSAIEDVASRLAMSKRSLQRRLNDEGSGFQDVLNATREELAQHYLSNSQMSPGEISFLLGFQDPNSFIRAFSGWTGRTPGEYRRSQ